MTTATLLDMEPTAPSRTLATSWLEPPMSVIDRRSGRWRQRSRAWRAIGITSGVGRPGGLVHTDTDYLRISSEASEIGTSVFDPALAELAYHWYSREGDRVLDPYAGGSVRGVVASCMGRWYTGVDLSAEQVAANEDQASLGSPDMPPEWVVGDSTHLDHILGTGHEADLIFTCPPYGDLEVYSDDPRDLSTMDWPYFVTAYRRAIRLSVDALLPDRFIAIVVGDVRDRRGAYRGLPAVTAQALADAGCDVIGDTVILDPLGSKQMTADRTFRAGRLTQRVHQYMITAVKGDRFAAASRLSAAA